MVNAAADPRGKSRPRILLVLAILFLATSACSRAVSIGTGPSPVYAVAVTNSSGQELIVSYDDGSGPKALGSVRTGATERFVIASPATTQVSISGRSTTGRTAGPITVELVAGETRPVTLR